MAGTKEIRTKIRSVQNTRKITKSHGNGCRIENEKSAGKNEIG